MGRWRPCRSSCPAAHWDPGPNGSVRNRSHHVRRDSAQNRLRRRRVEARTVRGGRHPTGGTVDNEYDPAMTRAGNVLIVLAAILGGAVAACSSDDATPVATTMADTVAPTTEPTVASTVPSTSAAPTTTVDPAIRAGRRSRSRLPRGRSPGPRGVARPLQRREGASGAGSEGWVSSPDSFEREPGRLPGYATTRSARIRRRRRR